MSPARGIAAVRAHLAKLPPQGSLTFEELRELRPRRARVPDAAGHRHRARQGAGGARELAARATAAGVDVGLEVWDTMVHVWHWFLPMLDEEQAAIDRIGAFVRERAR